LGLIYMSILSSKQIKRIRESYRASFGLPVEEISVEGECPELDDPISNLASLTGARAHALDEAIRWGEPYIFFLLPNVMSWVIPIVRETEALGGIWGGAVLLGGAPSELLESINHLSTCGSSRRDAEQWCSALPVWQDRSRPQKASEFLFALTCCELDWDMMLLSENRRKALCQRQIAEEIHRRKNQSRRPSPIDDEQTLLSLMKAGDQKGARRELNKTLGAIYSYTADTRLIKAHVIEMMGYLVRRAVEDSPRMGPLIERNHEWMTAIIEAEDFEDLSSVLAEALDDFMRNVYVFGQGSRNEAVSKALDYLCENFREPVTLEMLANQAGLSTYRLSHLLKRETGMTMLQHLHRLRVKEAQRLLEEGRQSCTEIAYETGFCDQSYFIKVFRKKMGITPARYRRLYHSRIEPRP